MGFRSALRAAGIVGLLVMGSVVGTVYAGPADAATRPDMSLVSTGLDSSVGHGLGAFVAMSIENLSSAPIPESGALTLTFPTGLSLGRYGVEQQGSATPAYCRRSTHTVTCSLHHVNTFNGRFLNVYVAAASSLPVGSKPILVARFVPAGGDADLSNNTLKLPILIRGVAHLTYSLSIPSTTLVRGRTVTATATITDVGRDPATHVLTNSGVLAQPHQFRITATGAKIYPNSQPIAEFSLGTVRVNHPVRIYVHITGLTTVSRATLLVNSGGADTIDPQPQCDSRACDAAASKAIRVVAA